MRKDITLLLSFLTLIFWGCAENFTPHLEPSNAIDHWENISEELDLPRFSDNYTSSPSMTLPTRFFNNKATIGRVLFYDKSLSSDETISCASCHKQELAFSDDVSFSKGVFGNLTTRNSYAIGSFRSLADEYYSKQEDVPGLFWDNRAATVKDQMIETLANPNEMGMELDELVSAVESKSYYQSLFALNSLSSGDVKINSEDILECLQIFLSSINSNSSKFDKAEDKNSLFLASPKPYNFTPSENNGKLLFNVHCNNCHLVSPFKKDPITNRTQFRPFIREMANNGLNKVYKDKGAGHRSEYVDSLEFYGLFKIPDLRNVAHTAPYMHDGRFKTLSDVLDHYSDSIQDHQNLHAQLKDASGNPKKFNFTNEEKEDLINFLHTLTDQNLLTHRKWSDPFKR